MDSIFQELLQLVVAGRHQSDAEFVVIHQSRFSAEGEQPFFVEFEVLSYTSSDFLVQLIEEKDKSVNRWQ